MKNSFTKVIILTLACSFPCFVHARELKLVDVLKSSNTHYPEIQAGLDKIDVYAAKSQEALGAFDLKLEGEAKLRGNGLYNGDHATGRFVKPLGPLNTKVYSGYRIGRGNFPIYDDELPTKDGGEVSLGIIFSLLRNREIDERRFKLSDTSLAQQLAGIDYQITKLSTQLKAQHAYAEWLAAGLTFRVYEDLLVLAQDRQKNLLTRIKAGDASQIMATENEQNLVKRRALLNDARRDFIKCSNNLSLFWRNKQGEPLIAVTGNVPRKFPRTVIPTRQNVQADINRIISDRPELKYIQLAMKQQQLRQRLGENNLLPDLDVGFELAKDQGRGLQRLEGVETIGMVKFSVPLQRNLGQGQVIQAQAQARQLKHKERLTTDMLRAEMYNLAADLEITGENLVLSDKEVMLAMKMQDAERRLLNNGISNLFLVNSREEKAAEARIKNILSNKDVFKTLGSYYAATMNFDRIHIANKK